MKTRMICAKSKSGKGLRLRPTCEKRKNGIRDFRADNRRQFLTRRASDAGKTAERGQERLPSARTDARHMIQFRSQVAHRPRSTVERDGEAMRLVTDLLDQQERGIVWRKCNRIDVIARVQQFLLL